MSHKQWVKVAVTNVEEDLVRNGAEEAAVEIYHHSLEQLSCSLVGGITRLKNRWYQEHIGQLRCAIEIGCVGILLETLLHSSYLAMPRVGHLEQALHIFGYLKTHPATRELGFDLAHLVTNENRFHKYNYMEFSRDTSEAVPDNMPKCVRETWPTSLLRLW